MDENLPHAGAQCWACGQLVLVVKPSSGRFPYQLTQHFAPFDPVSKMFITEDSPAAIKACCGSNTAVAPSELRLVVAELPGG